MGWFGQLFVNAVGICLETFLEACSWNYETRKIPFFVVTASILLYELVEWYHSKYCWSVYLLHKGTPLSSQGSGEKEELFILQEWKLEDLGLNPASPVTRWVTLGKTHIFLLH